MENLQKQPFTETKTHYRVESKGISYFRKDDWFPLSFCTANKGCRREMYTLAEAKELRALKQTEYPISKFPNSEFRIVKVTTTAEIVE